MTLICENTMGSGVATFGGVRVCALPQQSTLAIFLSCLFTANIEAPVSFANTTLFSLYPPHCELIAFDTFNQVFDKAVLQLKQVTVPRNCAIARPLNLIPFQT